MTLFSAPNYCGEFDNAGAMMSVDETLMCSFQVRSFCLHIPYSNLHPKCKTPGCVCLYHIDNTTTKHGVFSLCSFGFDRSAFGDHVCSASTFQLILFS